MLKTVYYNVNIQKANATPAVSTYAGMLTSTLYVFTIILDCFHNNSMQDAAS